MASAVLDRGWLVAMLAEGDRIFGHGRFGWWMSALEAGRLPDSEIPQIHWRSSGDSSVRENLASVSKEIAEKGQYKGPPLSPAGAKKHLLDLMARMSAGAYGGWDAMAYLIRWIAWGLAVNHEPEPPRAPGGPANEWSDLLYREFHLCRLQAADTDLLADVIMEQRGSGWNPRAFFATPMELCVMMVQMTMGDRTILDDGRDARLASVMDPCVGTGRMLLAASNYSVNMWACDIDPMMVDACAINLALFAPWAVYIDERARVLLSRGTPTQERTQAALEAMDRARQEQGHEALPQVVEINSTGTAENTPAVVSQPQYEFNKHGQGYLFSVPNKEQ